MYYIDFHCHILPGVDDGSPDIKTSEEMIKCAYDNGTRGFILTPHFKHSYMGKSIKEIKNTYDDFVGSIESKFPQALFFLGTEILFDNESVQNINDGKILTLAGTKFVLAEFRPLTPLSFIINAVETLSFRGYKPVIAHIERYDCLRNKPDEVGHLIDLGAFVQVNADSIAGENGLKVKLFCNKILANEWIHFIGSDAHDNKKRNADISSAAAKIEKKCSKQYAEKILFRNAVDMIQGKLKEKT